MSQQVLRDLGLTELLGRFTDSVVLYDRDGRYLYLHPEAERRLGKSSAELLGQVVWDLFPNAVGNAFHQAFRRTLDGGETERFEMQYGGSDRWYEVQLSRVGDAILSISRDITERRLLTHRLEVLCAAAQEFSAASGDYRQLLEVVTRRFCEAVGDLCVVRLVADDGEWFETTPVVWHSDEKTRELIRQIMAIPYRVGEGVSGHVVSSGRPLLIASISGELAGQIDAQYLGFIEKLGICSVLFVPITLHGVTNGVVMTARVGAERPYREDDLTLLRELTVHAALAIANSRLLVAARRMERESLAAAAREKEQRIFRGLLESAPDAMLIVGEHGRIILVNARALQLFGYEKSELIGNSIQMLIPPRYHQGHLSRRAEYFSESDSRPQRSAIELHGLRKDGSEFPVEVSLGSIQTEDGLVVSSALRDVTERKALTDALAQRAVELETVNKELEAFSYSVSHDLRSPLRALDGFSEALIDGYSDKPIDETGRDYLKRIRAASQRMGQLIDDLLKLSRLTRADMQKKRIDLGALVRTIVEELSEREPQRQVTVEIAASLITDGDPQLIEIALQNLIGNAWKFTSKNSRARIEVGALEVGGARAFFVRDDGAGFDMAYAHQLFGAFQRLHTQSEFEGTGIGLATVQRVVSRHGGRIWAEAEVGKGATFYFTL